MNMKWKKRRRRRKNCQSYSIQLNQWFSKNANHSRNNAHCFGSRDVIGFNSHVLKISKWNEFTLLARKWWYCCDWVYESKQWCRTISALKSISPKTKINMGFYECRTLTVRYLGIIFFSSLNLVLCWCFSYYYWFCRWIWPTGPIVNRFVERRDQWAAGNHFMVKQRPNNFNHFSKPGKCVAKQKRKREKHLLNYMNLDFVRFRTSHDKPAHVIK